MNFDQITLSNGLRIIGERIPHFRSVAVGIWVGSGSQFETPAEAGVSHFIEHMVFKGTKKRSARAIAEEMDAVGGMLNAFTAKECTCFYAKVVDEHLPLAMDVLADLVTAPTFDAGEMEKEKGVVLEEIAMAEDTPEDLAHELLMLANFGDQPVARPILGNAERIASYAREDLVAYWRRMYRPQNAVLALAGHYDWDAVVALAQQLLGGWSSEGFEARACAIHAVAPTVLVREKDIEQVHICLGYPGLKRDDERSYEEALFNSVFGGSMSSRLFQKIREERGAAYTVYSYPNAYSGAGMLSVYAATNPDAAVEVCGMLREEARKLAEEGMTEQEFTMAREQLKASYILGSESASARMQSIGRRVLLMNAPRTESEVIDRVNALRRDRVNELMHEMLSAEHSIALVGRGAGEIAEKIAAR